MTTTTTTKRLAGIALIAAATLNILRVLPMFLSDGVSIENFPPHTVDDLVFYTNLFGWSVSHMMGILSVPLLIIGCIALCRIVGHSTSSTLALVGFSTGMILYLVGLVSDGLLLPRVIVQLLPQLQANASSAYDMVWLTHAFATSFAGFSALVLLTSTGFLGVSILADLNRPSVGYVGIAIGSLSLLGFMSGYLNIIITDGLGRVGPLTLLMFGYLILCGVLIMKRNES